MEVRAFLRYLRISPRKVRLVARELKGMKAQEAVEFLEFVPKKAARPLKKLILSAIANAENNFEIPADNLYIKKIAVDEGPVYKRGFPRARGSMDIIRKRTSHIGVVLEEIEPGKRRAKTDKREKREEKKGDTEQEREKGTRATVKPQPKETLGKITRVKKPGFFRRKSIG